MIEAFCIPAHALSQDGAQGLIDGLTAYHPESTIHVLSADRLALDSATFIQIPVEEATAGLQIAISDTLEAEDALHYALPFALSQILGRHENVVIVWPGLFVIKPMDELEKSLEFNPVVLASAALPLDVDSSTPHLAQLSKPRAIISPRLAGFASGAEPFLSYWKAAMHESSFDVFQRRPHALSEAVLHSFLGKEGVTVAGGRALMAWTDYAAVTSGRAHGETAAVLSADELWMLGRSLSSAEETEVEVDVQMLADRVHDSRPLEAILEAVEAAVEAAPVAPARNLPFEAFAKDVRRSNDPTGAEWPAGSSSEFTEWLFTTDTQGLSRAAHLYWARDAALQRRFPDVRKTDLQAFRKWAAGPGLREIGVDLFDRNVEADPEPPDADHGEENGGRWSFGNAIAWRANTLKGLVPVVPGYGRWQRYVEGRRSTNEAAARRHPKPPKRVPAKQPAALYGTSPRSLNLIGCFRAESGLGQAARASLGALRLLGRDFSYVDTSEEYPSRNSVDVGLKHETFGAFGDVTLLHSNADELLTLNQRVFRNRILGRFNAAMWFWESANLPSRSMGAFDFVDELWVASEYLADVFGQYGKVPVHVVGLAANLPDVPEHTDRASFGLSDDEFVFLFVYDALSAHGRKNPEKALEAFVNAFAPKFENVRFVLKVSNLNKFPASQEILMRLADAYEGVTIIDEYFTRERVMALMSVADVYVSLHAAEGFGLTLLEAMALGTPTICTAYSGNMDFTTPDNSWLVDFDMIATDEQTGPYPPGSVWASPKVDAATDVMRWAFEHPAEVAAKAKRARVDALEAASLERYAERLDAQLKRVL